MQRLLFSIDKTIMRFSSQNIYRYLSRHKNILSTSLQTVHSQQCFYTTIANQNQKSSIKFEYGVASFPLVRQQNVFYADRTQYIPQIEGVGRVLLFLRPRRMGKSLLISMLEHYYDVRFEHQFKKLFGGLAIGESPTEEHNKYLVLKFDFSSLNTTTVDKFEGSLNNHINECIITFQKTHRAQFAELMESIKIYEDDAVRSFESLCGSFIENDMKLYLLIDEYDSSVNKILHDAQNAVYQKLLVNSDNTDSLKETQQINTVKENIFRRFFSSIKTQFGNGAVSRIFITGVSPLALNDFTSGFNIAKDITHYPQFAELCGLTTDELKNCLQKIIIDNPDKVNQVLQLMKENYNGLVFHQDQQNDLFNTTQAVYFMDHFVQFGEPPTMLTDRNVIPSQSTLAIISQSPFAVPVLSNLMTSGNHGITIEKGIEATLISSNMILSEKYYHSNQSFVLALMYYFGALTLVKQEQEEYRSGLRRLKIPNKVTETEFIQELASRLSWTGEPIRKLREAVQGLVDSKDIGPLCSFIQTHYLDLLRAGDIVQSKEQDIKASFLLALKVSGRFANIENEYDFLNVAKGVTNYADMMSFAVLAQKSIHIEFKNLMMHDIIAADGYRYTQNKSWDQGVKYAKEIQEMKENDVFKLKLQFSREGRHSGKLMETVQDVWKDLLIQTMNNKSMIEAKLGGGTKITSFAVLRVGLSRLIYKNID